ncbi:hypothetical protein LCGC14_0996830, partial [marine sediment metagenome]
MRDAIVRYIITLKDHREAIKGHYLGMRGNNRVYYQAQGDLLNDIIAELEGFVKQGGYEDEMKQALMEAYGGTDNAGEAMVEAATAAGLKDVRIEEEEWIAE